MYIYILYIYIYKGSGPGTVIDCRKFGSFESQHAVGGIFSLISGSKFMRFFTERVNGTDRHGPVSTLLETRPTIGHTFWERVGELESRRPAENIANVPVASDAAISDNVRERGQERAQI